MNEEAAKKAGKRWYWYLGLLLILQFFGIPLAIVKTFLYLIEGLPRHAVAQLANIFLDFGEWILVKVPQRIQENPFSGIGILIGEVLVLVIGIWLVRRKPRIRKEEKDVQIS